MRFVPKLVLSLVLVGGLGGAAYFYQNQHQKSEAASTQRNAVVVVKTAIASKKTIPVTVQTNGYVSAIDSVDVRPQVQNVIRAVHVTEGQDVRQGQLLFTLDERNDSAGLDKAKAQITRDRADLADAEASLKRNQELFVKGFVAQSVVDAARNKFDSVRATLQADQAGMQSSQVTLGFNQIHASISGRLGAINVHVGSLAQPSAAPLVSIARLDPIAISFVVPEGQLAYIRQSYPKGDAPVSAQIPNGKTVQGKLSFIDNTVDATTGTIRMKAEFANPDRLLWPGAFVNVSLVARTLVDMIGIPPQSIVTGPNDHFVYLVKEDGGVQRQKVDIVSIEEGIAAVTGVAAGARVVVEGVQNLRPNSKVKEAESGGGKARAGAAK